MIDIMFIGKPYRLKNFRLKTKNDPISAGMARLINHSMTEAVSIPRLICSFNKENLSKYIPIK
jgi:hypothetical protein